MKSSMEPPQPYCTHRVEGCVTGWMVPGPRDPLQA